MYSVASDVVLWITPLILPRVRIRAYATVADFNDYQIKYMT